MTNQEYELRKEFESDLSDHLTERNQDGDYCHDDIQNSWMIAERDAEIARLTQGYKDLKDWMQSIIENDCYDDFDHGMDAAFILVIQEINKITGEGE